MSTVHPAALVHPTASVHPTAALGEQAIVGYGATVGAHVKIGDRAILWRNVSVGDFATIEEDAVVDDDLDEGDPNDLTNDPFDVVTITGTHDGRATAPAAGVTITITDDDAAPPAPANLAAAFSNGTVSLTWDRITTANPTVTGYEYCYGSAGACNADANPQATWHAIANSNEFTVGHNVDASGFANGDIQFQVRARNSVGAGVHTADVQVTIAN